VISPEQVRQSVKERISQQSAIMPDTLQKSVSDGMLALINIENRIRNQSGNINHLGIGIDAVHDTYMAFLRGGSRRNPTTKLSIKKDNLWI